MTLLVLLLVAWICLHQLCVTTEKGVASESDGGRRCFIMRRQPISHVKSSPESYTATRVGQRKRLPKGLACLSAEKACESVLRVGLDAFTYLLIVSNIRYSDPRR